MSGRGKHEREHAIPALSPLPVGEGATARGKAVSTPDFATINWRTRPIRIECQWIATERTDAPLIVFLHEGLGSVAMWKDFPAQVCNAANARGLVFSRPGYGRSTPREENEIWGVDFMHRQAHEVLPALFAALKLDDEKPWLFGHSDGEIGRAHV